MLDGVGSLLCFPRFALRVRQLFGAVKQEFPALKTMATVRWVPQVDDGLNIDIWVTLYSLWNSTAADAFRRSAKGREAWAYHCISPRPAPVSGPMYVRMILWTATDLPQILRHTHLPSCRALRCTMGELNPC